jgi:stalled ribosome rescue protein Dom34
MSHFYAVVWMDHAEAHVLQFAAGDVEKTIIHSKGGNRHIHHHRGAQGSGKAAEDVEYFAAVVKSLDGAQQILLTGPANEKVEFKKHLDSHVKAVAQKVVSVANSDHPTDGELLRQARKFFNVADKAPAQS